MDFQSVNPLNVRLNLISGNLLPMTADGTVFSTFWKIHSVFVWLLTAVHTSVLIYGCTLVPREKALKDGSVALVITVEVIFMVMQIHARKRLVLQLIKKMNEILCLKNEMIKDIVIALLKSMKIPLKFYWMAGVVSIIVWCSAPFVVILERNYFFYVDYRMPVFYAEEPFSISIFVLGTLILMVSSMYTFTKKVSVDSYMIHMILLVTAQYKYIASKLSMIFQDGIHNNGPKERYSNVDCYTEKEIKSLCQHHNLTLQIILLLKTLLSLNLSLIYVNSVFRFCFIGVMILSISSTTLLETSMIIIYASGAIVQLYILCSCVQQLLDAGIEITDKAFHEEWYRYGKSIKHMFVILIMANNLDCKLSTFDNLNLSLSSFMQILNSSYSIAILLSKTT
ncbi:ObirOr5-A6 [Ooceraea biroi]|uniref:Odorant receptor n=1 Tax=Ooceraea biroi TaxID=2015173 RepID=A0A026X0G8_OOCBI|nr:odorant receptor 67a [Ooceraea biroi]XP_011343880.1 odorant receptor 67a [Ooceraea biroi]XP_011343888.1 odorant receptor 67a [Ooceraea biroi]XP_026824751.1 odorant receptor 67a [Ooceraea biroi]EZA61767.1 hypothetical protein X777_09388 [Ooceraea biroi]RLU24237.1 ObirOr5-A6 [Ooceraea biroi]